MCLEEGYKWCRPTTKISFRSSLGVIVCQDLWAGKQCFRSTSKGKQMLGMINRTFKIQSKNIMIPLDKSLGLSV